MRADAIIRLRVAEQTKDEWRQYAREHGIRLSDFVRLACRLSALIGYDRLASGLADFAAARRDLHAVMAELRNISQSGRHPPDEIRAVLARVNVATESISAVIRGRAA